MNIIPAFKSRISAIAAKYYRPTINLSSIDKEIQDAFAELEQRQKDFEMCSTRHSESVILYLKASEIRLNELIRERKSESTKANFTKDKGTEEN